MKLISQNLAHTIKRSSLLNSTAALTASLPNARNFSASSFSNSNIGKLAIEYPESVHVFHKNEPYSQTDLRFKNTSTLKVVGPLGELEMAILPFVKLQLTEQQKTQNADASSAQSSAESSPAAKSSKKSKSASSGSQMNQILVSVANTRLKQHRQMWGTTRALIKNMVTGVTEGYTSMLRMVGIGYRASLETVNGVKNLQLKLGYSHPVNIPIPDKLTVSVPFPTTIIVNGIDLQQVKLFAAKVREKKKPEPYNQKGIFVDEETIRKKEGKKK
ncbi:50S ribosomal protein L6 [Smittium culicis]|uniref:50S ribosomal protein L6 n=1 Tax=Smittium culicis TaxID=133412 RepID=A0A1R1XNW1_9FUNG|nr:50S ribosomal protein L6 [Smittium culicis]OMJ16313.1 50S ribosomal protein L6 [Smittium culicis]